MSLKAWATERASPADVSHGPTAESAWGRRADVEAADGPGDRQSHDASSPVPYLNCPHCRLTVYNPPAVVAPEKCPRCGGKLSDDAPTLFSAQVPLSRLDVDRVMRLKAERRGLH